MKLWIPYVIDDRGSHYEMLESTTNDYPSVERYVLASDYDALLARNSLLEAALLKISRYDPGVFRKLQDEIDIYKIACDALGPDQHGDTLAIKLVQLEAENMKLREQLATELVYGPTTKGYDNISLPDVAGDALEISRLRQALRECSSYFEAYDLMGCEAAKITAIALDSPVLAK